MFSLLDYIKMGASFAAGVLVAGTVAYSVGLGVGHSRGVAEERTRATALALETIKNRSRTNAEVRNLDSAAICRELGGKWVHDTCQ